MPRFVTLALTAWLAWAAAGRAEHLKAEQLKVGAAAVKITPPPGTAMAGYYHERGSQGVHDDLFAKAIVLQHRDAKAALVGLDVIRTSRELVDRARREIEAVSGIRGDHVMISATHTHTGPEIAAGSPRYDRLSPAGKLAQEYTDTLPKRIAQCVRQAEAALAPGRAMAAVGQEDSIAFNRRFHMKDGSVGWNPGKQNPNVVKPAGPIDPDVPVVYFERPDAEPLACYVNYAVHLDNVGGPEISADLPYTLSKCLADVQGKGFLTLYTTGCCGDVNHIDIGWARRQHGHTNAARMGTILAAEVLRSLPDLKEAGGPLCVRREIVRLPLPEITSEELDTAREVAGRSGKRDSTRVSFMETVKAFKVLDVAAREGRPLEVEVQVITLGDQVAWVSLPGEVFVELGLALKQDSPFPYTIIAELANGSIGYIPSRRAYPQGNYEVVSARCAEGSGELLVRAAVRMLKEIYVENLRTAGS